MMHVRPRSAHAAYATVGLARTVVFLGLVLHGSACDQSKGRIGHAVHRDSAGIHITENSEVRDAEGPWIVGSEPIVEIGVVDGDEAYQLFRVTDAARLSNGGIVVVNAGTRELRVYDETGRFIRALGRQGAGPGELGYSTHVVVLPGDTLLTFDGQRWKQVWFHASGDLVREQTADRSPYPAGVAALHPLPGGQLFTSLWGPWASKPGPFRQQMAFLLIDPNTGTADTLGWFGAVDLFVRRDGDGLRPGGVVPFGRNTWWALGTDRVFVGDNDRYELLVYGLDGAPRQIIRLDRPADPVTETDRNEYQEAARAWRERRGPEAVTHLNQFLREVEWPSTKPAFERVYADTENRLWVKHFTDPPFNEAPYDVFDTSGAFIGTVVLPNGVEPLEIGTDYLIGLWRDESDVEFVQLYALRRR
jgi:hypothetical protein